MLQTMVDCCCFFLNPPKQIYLYSSSSSFVFCFFLFVFVFVFVFVRTWKIKLQSVLRSEINMEKARLAWLTSKIYLIENPVPCCVNTVCSQSFFLRYCTKVQPYQLCNKSLDRKHTQSDRTQTKCEFRKAHTVPVHNSFLLLTVVSSRQTTS